MLRFPFALRKSRRVPRDPASLQRVKPLSPLRRLLRISLIYFAVVGVCVFLDGKAFDNAEQYAYNLRMSVYGQYHRDEAAWVRQQIVLVPFTDATFNEVGGTERMLSRRLHAKVVGDLSRAGASVIAFDMVFDRPSEGGEDRDFARLVVAAPMLAPCK